MATGGSALNFERFAYDSLVFSMEKFYPDVVLPKPQSSQNNYEHPDFLHIISTGIIGYQLQIRDMWKPRFITAYKSNRLRKFKQVSKIWEEGIKDIDGSKWLTLRPFLRTIFSIAVINEIIQFLYSKHCHLFLNDLASSWSSYFAGFQEDFESVGGFSGLYALHNEDIFRKLDNVIDNFIPNYCIPYGKLGVSVFQLFEGIVETLGLSDTFILLEKVVVQDTKGECDPSALDSRFREKLTISSKSHRKVKSEKTLASDSLENAGLGIRKHEEQIRDCYSLSVDDDAFSEKYDIESSVEGATAAEIHLPEGQSKDRGALTGSPLIPEEQSKGRGSFTGSPFGPERQLKGRGSLGESLLGPEGQTKGRGGLTGSLLSPERQTKGLCGLTGSLLSPERQTKGRCGLTGSLLSPEGQTKGRGGLTGSPLSPEGQSTGRGSLSGSPGSPKEQKHSRDSQRTPKGISRLEQKRLKHLQFKRTEPSD